MRRKYDTYLEDTMRFWLNENLTLKKLYYHMIKLNVKNQIRVKLHLKPVISPNIWLPINYLKILTAMKF